MLHIDMYYEEISCRVCLAPYIHSHKPKQLLKTNTLVWGIAYRLFLSLPLSVHLWVWAPSPLLLCSDSRLFSPSLSRDLIEGNHSHKKPSQWCCCTCVYMSTFVRAPLPSCPALCCSLNPPPPIKMPRCSVDPCLALYFPKRAFCGAWRRGTVSGREWGRGIGDWG